MNKEINKPFIPRDYPKSWVIVISAGLSALLIAAPIMVLGTIFKISLVKEIGTTLFILCWLIGAFYWFIFMSGIISGKYKNIKQQNWKKTIMVIKTPKSSNG